MPHRRPSWLSLVLPSAIPSMLVAGGLWPYSPELAYAAAGGGLAAFMGGACKVSRDLWKARRQLSLSTTPTGPIGSSLTDGLLEEMGTYLDEIRQGLVASDTARTQSEMKQHVRLKELKRIEASMLAISEPVFVLDAAGMLIFANSIGEILLNSCHRTEDSDGLKVIPELHQLALETQRRAAATRTRQVELTIQTEAGKAAYRATGVNLKEADGSPAGVLIMLRDMSAELGQKTRHAEFVSSVSHELKTPLASIKAFLELITDGDVDDPEEQQQLYGLMDLQIDRLTRLINNMLNLARIESGVVQIKREDCELNEILVKVLEVITPVAMEKRIAVKPELSELFIPVEVDRDLFSQAIINLLSNAVKYTPEGGEVRLRSRLQDGEVTIDVRDTGMGIPEVSLPKIFERFYRVPENNQAAAGTGLGLAFVQHIVSDVHGGRISVSSKVGEGSCFTVILPVGHHKGTSRKTSGERIRNESDRLVGAAASND